jgi:phosphoribosylaminoimidazole-succinocarboxamide synthase
VGSVKDLIVLQPATKPEYGHGIFNFSDRYSVFDWGEMPDTIPLKGAATAILGAYFFEKLESRGYETHYAGLVEDGKTMPVSMLAGPSASMKVDLVNVCYPSVEDGVYDYSEFRKLDFNVLIPLEIIYRNFLPEGSSVFKRLSKGEITYADLKLDKNPVPGTHLHTPFIDFSTKLEITDRYISDAEAKYISGLTEEEMETISVLTRGINNIISREYKKINAVNLDGKIELARNEQGDIVLVDVLGTLDECRFELNGLPLSKEVARMYYRNSDWYHETERAKEQDRQNWKKICKLQPQPLPERFKFLLSQMYCKVTNEITEREWFDVPFTLNEIVDEIKTFTR